MGLLEKTNLRAQMYGKLSSLNLMTEIDSVSETLISKQIPDDKKCPKYWQCLLIMLCTDYLLFLTPLH
jgi:hypothetical protein